MVGDDYFPTALEVFFGMENQMRVLVTGAAGQVGCEVVQALKKRGHFVIGSSTRETTGGEVDAWVRLDITDAEAVKETLASVRPDAVIHCAAWTKVDLAEEPAKKETVYATNVAGTKQIAQMCKELGCKMLFISTDYVFDGTGELPWEPDDTICQPVNVYGQTKYEGEQIVSSLLEQYFIVRIAWLFGIYGENFVKTMLNVGKKYDTVRVVRDQIGTPTYAYDVAQLLAEMIESEQYGYYHATNEGGYISWYDFTCEIYRQAGYATKVVPVTTEEYGLSKAARPRNSRMNNKKLLEKGFSLLPDWKDALARYLKNAFEMENDLNGKN